MQWNFWACFALCPIQGHSQRNFNGGARPEPYIHTQETSSHSCETLSKTVKGVCTWPITNCAILYNAACMHHVTSFIWSKSITYKSTQQNTYPSCR